MLLGKSPRPYIRRTTSMSGIATVDLPTNVNDVDASEPSDDQHHHHTTLDANHGHDDNHYYQNHNSINNNTDAYYYDQRFLATIVSPRINNNNNNNLKNNNNENRRSKRGKFDGGGENEQFEETSHFLRTCCLCNRRLAPTKDIYMYRGDTAFCSLECREQQMRQDERRERANSMTLSTITPSMS